MKEPRTARERGHWPERGPEVNRSEPWIPVTVYMPASLYSWYRDFVAASHLTGMFRNVGIGVMNALESIAGRDYKHGHDLYSLAEWSAGLRETDIADVMFRAGDERENRNASNALVLAAAVAMRPYADELPDDPEQNALIRRILAAAGVEVIDDDPNWTEDDEADVTQWSNDHGEARPA